MVRTADEGTTSRMGAPVRIYFGVLFLVVGVMTYATFPGVREQPGLVPLYDDYVQTTGYVLAAGGALWYLLTHRDRRLLWGLVTLALISRAGGFAHTIFVLHREPVYPSFSDALWITSSLVLVAALVVVAREVVNRSQLLALDALIGGLAAAAAAWLFLRDTILAAAPSGAATDVLLTNLTYPLLDVVLFVLIAALVGQSQGRLSLSVGLLVVGIAMFAVVDAVFLFQLTEGTWRPGQLVTPLSMLGTTLIALSPWLSPRILGGLTDSTASGLSAPVGLAMLCVAVLAYDAVVEVPATSVLFASLGVVVAIVRGFLTFTGDRADNEQVIRGKDEEVEQFRAMVEASSDFIAIAELDSTVTYINPSGRAMVGLDAAEPVEMTIADTLYEKHQKRAIEVERPQIMAEGSWRGESLLRHQRGGEDTPVMKSTFLVRHPETRAPWLLATIQRDISELRAAQTDLESFQSLVEASSDFIALAELDGTVRYLNPAGRRLVGMDEDVDVTTTKIADFLTEDRGFGTPGEIAQKAVVAEGHWQGESTLRHLRGGPPIPVTVNSFLIRRPHTGEPWLLATVQRDITALNAARTSLQKLADVRQELLQHLIEAQEAERSRIAADVHDDSVQALAAVDLQLGLLHRRVSGTSPEVDETLALVRESVTRANDRLRHLLFDLDSPAQRYDLATVLEDAAAYLFEGRVRWRVEAEPDVDLPEAQRIMAHRMAKEAMVNIGKHAQAENVLIRVRRLAVGVEVAITDDGVGMPAGEPQQQPGHRGLTDMRDRAMIAGGWVRYERARPKGTTIRIWMPSSATPA